MWVRNQRTHIFYLLREQVTIINETTKNLMLPCYRVTMLPKRVELYSPTQFLEIYFYSEHS